jgi:hypothetical protein
MAFPKAIANAQLEDLENKLHSLRTVNDQILSPFRGAGAHNVGLTKADYYAVLGQLIDVERSVCLALDVVQRVRSKQ